MPGSKFLGLVLAAVCAMSKGRLGCDCASAKMAANGAAARGEGGWMGNRLIMMMV